MFNSPEQMKGSVALFRAGHSGPPGLSSDGLMAALPCPLPPPDMAHFVLLFSVPADISQKTSCVALEVMNQGTATRQERARVIVGIFKQAHSTQDKGCSR